mmetsp:Transcript_41122/g.132736  ORF Transcript_41122/g.132736 Transcript_41122/m.132736 type:complete len:180 (-) Transcript_41122:293-832(-)
MLYIMIREHKPAETIEIGALCGSSTRWILAALERNGHGHLTTYDLHDYTPSFVNRSFAPSVLKHRWSFVQGDAIAALDKDDVPFDAELLFIDALHRNSFAQLYTDRLLRKAAAAISHPLPVFVHDIFSPFMIQPSSTVKPTCRSPLSGRRSTASAERPRPQAATGSTSSTRRSNRAAKA